MVSSCVAWDYGLTAVVLLINISLLVIEREEYMNHYTRLLAAATLVWYFAQYLYVGYFAELISGEALAWTAAILIVVFLLVLGSMVTVEFIGFGVFFFMVSHGLLWYASLIGSFVVGVVFWLMSCMTALDRAINLLCNSFILAFNVTSGVLGLFAQTRAANSPDACYSAHINMILVCDLECGTVLTNTTAIMPLSWFIIMFISVGLLRFVLVYIHIQQLNAAPESDSDKEQSEKHKFCRSLCSCWYKRQTQKQFTAVDAEGDEGEEEGDEGKDVEIELEDMVKEDNDGDKKGGDEEPPSDIEAGNNRDKEVRERFGGVDENAPVEDQLQ